MALEGQLRSARRRVRISPTNDRALADGRRWGWSPVCFFNAVAINSSGPPRPIT
jgi:hypothetical protein